MWSQLLKRESPQLLKANLPANVGQNWQSIFISDSATDKFISDIESRDFDKNGIDKTIAILQHWDNPENAFELDEVFALYTDPFFRGISKDMVIARIEKVKGVLPDLVNIRRGQKTASGKIGGKVYVKYDLTPENMEKELALLDSYDDKEITWTLNHWVDYFQTIKGVDNSIKNLLLQHKSELLPLLGRYNYKDTDIPISEVRQLRMEIVGDFPNIEEMLKKEGFKEIHKKDGKVIFAKLGKEADLRVDMDKLQEIPRTPPKISNHLRLVMLLEKFTEISEKARRFQSVEITDELVRRYLKNVINNRVINKSFVPEALINSKLIKKMGSKYKTTNQIMLFMDDKYDLIGNSSEQFLYDLKNSVFTNEKVFKDAYAKKIFNLSSTKGEGNPNPSHKLYFVDIKNDSYRIAKPKIMAAIGSGYLAENYTSAKTNYSSAVQNAITPAQKEFFKELLTEISEGRLDIPNNIEDKLIILDEVKNLFSTKTIDEVEIDFIEESHNYKLFAELFNLIDSDSNLKGEFSNVESDENLQTKNKIVVDLLSDYKPELQFNESAFSTNLEKILAEIIYTAILGNESLENLISGRIITPKGEIAESESRYIADFATAINIIAALDAQYTEINVDKIINIWRELDKSPKNIDFETSPPPLANEIKSLATMLSGSIPKFRELIRKDIKSILDDVVDKTLLYWGKAGKNARDVFDSLVRNGLLIEVS